METESNSFWKKLFMLFLKISVFFVKHNFVPKIFWPFGTIVLVPTKLSEHKWWYLNGVSIFWDTTTLCPKSAEPLGHIKYYVQTVFLLYMRQRHSIPKRENRSDVKKGPFERHAHLPPLMHVMSICSIYRYNRLNGKRNYSDDKRTITSF